MTGSNGHIDAATMAIRAIIPVALLQRSCLLLRSIIILIVLLPKSARSIPDRTGGRYSYSLTTFDPTGKLGQVERAMEAAQQGTPIVALVYHNSSDPEHSGILLAAPQVLPDLFTLDDGTPRFSLVTPEICVAHSGLSADGRVVVAAAQRLAQQHEYTFDESIDITIFLEELSLLFQEYTMKPASRPFGVSLVVAYLPRKRSSNDEKRSLDRNIPALYRVDPSGHVEALGRMAVVHGSRSLQTNVQEQLSSILVNNNASARDNFMTIETLQSQVVQVLRIALRRESTKNGEGSSDVDDLTILTAFLSGDGSSGSVFGKGCHEPGNDAAVVFEKEVDVP